MVVLKCKIWYNQLDTIGSLFCDNPACSDVFHSFRALSYKFLYTISCEKTSIVYKLGFNGFVASKDINDLLVIEFNPNKLSNDEIRQYVFDVLLLCRSVVLDRCDIAVDIPFSRDQFRLLKDRRDYRYFDNGSSLTEYLGKRSSSGACKLYDKSKESNLSCPCTRFEITLSKDNNYLINLPFIIFQGDFDLSSLDSKYKELVYCFSFLPLEYRKTVFNQFPNALRARLKGFLFADYNSFTVSQKAVAWVLKLIQDTYVVPYDQVNPLRHFPSKRENYFFNKWCRAINTGDQYDIDLYYKLYKECIDNAKN